MKLKILLPTQVLLEEDVRKVSAEAENGSFALLPHHIDFVTVLAPGLLIFETQETGNEGFVAVDKGILVKCDSTVLVSTGQAVQGESLETLHQTVEQQFRTLGEREKKAHATLARLEAGFVRGVYQIGGDSYEASQ